MKKPLLRLLFRKMWNTRWLTLSTLLGLTVAVAFTTAIPMYADGSLKRVIAASLELKEGGLPAGAVLIRYQAAGNEKVNLEDFEKTDTYIREEIPTEIAFPVQVSARSLSLRSARISPVDPGKVDASKRRQMTLMAMSGLKEQIEMTGGRVFSDQMADGVVEAVVMEEAMFRNDVAVGDEFYYPIYGSTQPLKIKIVGSFTPKPESASYWFQGQDMLASALLVSDDVFVNELMEKQKLPLSIANWYFAFDLKDIRISHLGSLEDKLERLDIVLYQMLKNTKVDISFKPMLEEFKKQSLQLQTLLFTLAAPMIAMVFYFITMNARQALDRQRSDIAVLRSRGASSRQIMGIFLLEGLILGACALLLGPVIGWFMAKSIGSSTGFLTFVDRKAIPVGVTWTTLLYGVIAVIIALAASVIPAILFARDSIVSYKQHQARVDKKPFWHRWFLDILLLGISAFGWYLFRQHRLISLKSGLTADQIQVHPLLFFVPALSIAALGLFFLRVFPWLLKLANALGKRMFSVPVYLTLTQLSRSATSYYPLMILLILTLGLGIYNASAARTIDQNSTERLLYKYGADVIVQTSWEAYADLSLEPPENGGNDNGENGEEGQNGGGQNGNSPGPPGGMEQPPSLIYVEPPFIVFNELEGVKKATRVLKTKGNFVISGRSVGQGNVMGIDNVDFAEVAWFRPDLFKPHPNIYLNLLGYYENAAIVPASFKEKYHLKEGDLISVSIQQQMVDFIVVAFLPYWPTQYPEQTPFIVANLDYIYDQVPIMPYEVWMKMEEGAKLAPAVQTLMDKGIQLASVVDVRSELISQNKHPARGGVYGILSLGFLVSALITLIGYALYWFFNLSSRVLQFGVLRAMGLSRRQLTWMLFLEQGFTAGLSIVLGIAIGKLASFLFLPFLQTAENVKMQVPPFRVVFEAKDSYQLYFVVTVMLCIGAALLFGHIRRLRVHQAVKLGEER